MVAHAGMRQGPGRRLGLALLASWLLACAPAAPSTTPAPTVTAPAAQVVDRSADQGPTAPAKPALVKLTAAYSALGPSNASLWLAYERGYLAQHGIDAELAFLPATASTQAIVGHNAQFALIGPQGIDVNLEHGSSLVHYVAGVTTRFVYKLMGQPELASVQDLRGRVVAVSRRGSMGYHGMRKVLELNQLRPDADVAFLYPGSDEAAFEAFLVGHADAVLASPPRDLVATRQGKKMLLDVEQLNIPFLGAGIIVRTDYAAANVDIVERFLKGYLQGIATWLTDPETSVDVLAKYQQSDDRALLRAGYEAFRPTKSRDQLVPEEAVLATVQASEHPAARSANPREFYDNSYLERLKQSGFVDQLYAGR